MPRFFQAQAPDGTFIQFIEDMRDDDGHCGFSSLEITRKQLYDTLSSVKEPERKRRLVREMIDAFMSYEQYGNGLPSPESWQYLREQQKALQMQVDSLVRDAKEKVRNHVWQGLPSELRTESSHLNTNENI